MLHLSSQLTGTQPGNWKEAPYTRNVQARPWIDVCLQVLCRSTSRCGFTLKFLVDVDAELLTYMLQDAHVTYA